MHTTRLQTGKKRTVLRGIGVAVAATAASWLLAGCSGAEKTPQAVVPVQAVAVQRAAINQVVTGEAMLVPLDQAILSAKVSAPIERFYVQRGARVHKGELLAVLENKDLAGAALGSQGQYQQAQAQYVTAVKSTIPQEMKKAEHDVAQAKAEMDLQQRIYTSQKKLFQEGALPGRTVDQTKVALVQATTQYGIQLRNLQALQKVSGAAQMQAAKGQLEQAKGQYQEAAATLAYTEIRSPIDGYVTDRPLYAGEMASAGTPILTVMNTSVLIAKAHLPQSQVERMKLGDAAKVMVPGLSAPVAGTVSLISPALDPGSTTVEVWVKVDNKNQMLKPGTPVQVAIAARTIEDALVVPTPAIVEDPGGGKHVMVVGADNIAHRHEVKTGVQSGDRTQVLSGIQAGEEVITVGAYALDDGTHVKVTQAAATDETKTGSAD